MSRISLWRRHEEGRRSMDWTLIQPRSVRAWRAEGVLDPWRTAFWLDFVYRVFPHRLYQYEDGAMLRLGWYWRGRRIWQSKTTKPF